MFHTVQYNTSTIRSNTVRCARDLRGDETVFTYIQRMNDFSCYTSRLFLQQLNDWRKQGLIVRDCNVREVRLNGRTFWMFTVQWPANHENEETMTLCPLAVANGLLVHGISYFTSDRNLLEIIRRTIGISDTGPKRF
jgi:hypothetical protein